jgi:hypothetical protein
MAYMVAAEGYNQSPQPKTKKPRTESTTKGQSSVVPGAFQLKVVGDKQTHTCKTQTATSI